MQSQAHVTPNQAAASETRPARLVPTSLFRTLRPVTIVVGHYGAGKTNFCVNLALDLKATGAAVTVVDLDIVNNSHLKDATTQETIELGERYAA